MKRFTGRCDSD